MLYTAAVLVFVFMGVLGATAIWHGRGLLHWGRFLFRGWVLLSLVWVVTIGAVGWRSIVAPLPPAENPRCFLPTSTGCLGLKLEILDQAAKGRFAEPERRTAPLSLKLERAAYVAAVALVPPFGLLGVGLACAWVLRGLRGGAGA
jgi:hypothetical protein